MAARRRSRRGRLQAAGALVGGRDVGCLRAPDGGGRACGAGEGGLVHRAGGDLVTGALEIIQADRARWQRQAAAELAAILDAHPGLPAIAWTVGPAGCVLAGAGERPGPGRAGPGRVRCLAGGAGAGGIPRAPARRRGDLAARGGPPRSGEGPADRGRLRRRQEDRRTGEPPAAGLRPDVPAGLLQKLMAAVRPEFRAECAGVRSRRPGVRPRRVPGGRVRVACARQRDVPGSPAAVARGGTA